MCLATLVRLLHPALAAGVPWPANSGGRTRACACGRSRCRSLGLGLLWVVLVAAPALASHGGDGTGPPPVIQPEVAQRLLEAGEAVLFIDLRSAEAFRAGRLPGARSIPFWDLLTRYREVPQVGRVVLYCDCTLKELQDPYRFLWEKGYRNLAVLQEGFAGWTKRGYPVER
jgi:rhodanese-related sulfurtransferase